MAKVDAEIILRELDVRRKQARDSVISSEMSHEDYKATRKFIMSLDSVYAYIERLSKGEKDNDGSIS